jgi:putative transposase
VTRSILQQAQAGTAVKVLCAKHNISQATFHAWKRKFGGMNVSEARRLRALADENALLKRLVADGLLQIQILQEVNAKNGKPVLQAAGGPRERARVRASSRGGLARWGCRARPSIVRPPGAGPTRGKSSGSGRTQPTTEPKSKHFMHVLVHLAKGTA